MSRARHAGALALVVAVVAAVAVPGCEPSSRRAARWEAAREAWDESRDPTLYETWERFDPATREGAEAHARLARAREAYARGIAHVAEGHASARDDFAQALALGPMPPHLYLPLARAFRRRSELEPGNAHVFIRAAEYYRKFLALAPEHPEAEAARDELEALDPDALAFGAPLPLPRRVRDEPTVDRARLSVLFLLAAGLGFAALAWRLLRRRRRTLLALAASRPELHPAIAYLIATLRHELLKHRIAAAAATPDSVAMLYRGERIDALWRSHLGAFERGLGGELDLTFDPLFGPASRAIRALAKLERAALDGSPRALDAVSRHVASLREFDSALARLRSSLTRTPVDGALLREVYASVRAEVVAGSVPLEAASLDAPDPAPAVEVFREDLVLILKNIVRNALHAMASSAPRKQLAMQVVVDVLPTGEERVRVRVLDSATQPLSTADLRERKSDRGLGIAHAALRRYDGVLAVEQAPSPYTKAVSLSFFVAPDSPGETPPSRGSAVE